MDPQELLVDAHALHEYESGEYDDDDLTSPVSMFGSNERSANDEISFRIAPAVRRMLLRAYLRFSSTGQLDLKMQNSILEVLLDSYERYEQMTYMADSSEIMAALEHPDKENECYMDDTARSGCGKHPNEYVSECRCNFIHEKYFLFREFRSKGMFFLNLDLNTVPDMPAQLKKPIVWSTRLIVCNFNKTLANIPKVLAPAEVIKTKQRAICHALRCYTMSTLKYAIAWDNGKQTFLKKGMRKGTDLATDLFECEGRLTDDVSELYDGFVQDEEEEPKEFVLRNKRVHQLCGSM